MRIALAGPVKTATFRQLLGLRLENAPDGDAATPVDLLACGLVERGYDVHVVTLVYDGRPPAKISEGRLTLHFLEGRARARDLSLTFFSKEIDQVANTFHAIQPDVVHAHWTYEFAEAAIRSGFPYLVTMHDNPWKIFWLSRDAYRFFRLLMALRTIPRIKNLAAVSPHISRSACLYGYYRDVAIVPNGVIVSSQMDRVKNQKLDRPIRIVTVGHSGRLKNVRASVEAFALIRKSFPSAELHLFGPELDYTFGPVESGIYGHGAVPQKELMRFLEEEGTLLVHPSLEESFGMIIAEAMARGLPCVAGWCSGGAPYLLGTELEFMLVNVRDREQIANKVIEVLCDRTKYNMASEVGIERVRRLFSDAIMTDRYCELYRRVIAAAKLTG
jgi:glycosyltransferase involved in cell wall biosynthesis